jgi:DNA-binding NarL/FixJ family response regulator
VPERDAFGRGPVEQVMSMDCSKSDTADTAIAPLIATLVHDDLAARRIESALNADGMSIGIRGWSTREPPDESELEPDVLVVGFGRGVTERDQQLRRIRRRLPDVHIVVVMPEDSRRGVRRALESGAEGVVFESELEAALSLTVRVILAGQTAVPAARRHELDRPTLSSREKQVLGMVVTGKSNKAIAGELFLAESTVKCHLSSAFSKLGVRSRNEAADLVLQSGSELGFSTAIFQGAGATTEGSEQ